MEPAGVALGRRERVDGEERVDNAPTTGDVERPARTTLRARILITIAAAAVLLISVAFIPVTTVREIPKGEDLELPGWERIDLAGRTELAVTNLGPSPVAVAGPTLEYPEILPSSAVEAAELASWDAAAGHWAVEPGGFVRFSGVFGSARFSVATLEKGDSRVAVVRSESGYAEPVERVVEVGSAGSAIESPSLEARYERTTALAAWLLTGSDAPPVSDSSITVAAHVVPGSAARVDTVSAAAMVAVKGWLLVGLAALILFFSWLGGLAVDRSREEDLRQQVIRMLGGFSIVACMTAAFSYLVPTKWAAVPLSVAFAAVLWVNRGAVRAKFWHGFKELLRAGAWLVLPVAFLFFPLIQWGGWYAGQYKTDLFFYSTMASIVRDNSLISMQTLPDAQRWVQGAGFDFRAIDSTCVSLLTTLTPLSTVASVACLAVSLFFLYGLAVLAFGSGPQESPLRRLVAMALLFCPVFVGLHVENYFSHFWFVAMVPGLFLVLWRVLQRGPEESLDRFGIWATAAVTACLIAVYPYFFVVVGAACALAAMLNGVWRRNAIRLLWPLAWRTVLLVNFALITVFRFGAVEGAAGEQLDGITRNWLIGPYSPAQLTFLGLGAVPYQWRRWGVEPTDDLGQPGTAIWRVADLSQNIGPLHWTLLGVCVLVVLAGIRWRLSARYYVFAASLLAFLFWMAFGAAFGLSGRPYPALKGLWTGLALLPPVLLAAKWRSKVVLLGSPAIALVVALWVGTGAADRVQWVINRQGVEASMAHASAQPELAAISEVLDGTETPVIIARGEQPLAGSDRDRVLEAHSEVLARDHGLAFSVAEAPSPTDCWMQNTTLILVGRSAEAERCGAVLAHRGRFTEVWLYGPGAQ